MAGFEPATCWVAVPVRDQPPGPSFIPAALPLALHSHVGEESPYPRRAPVFPGCRRFPKAHHELLTVGCIDWQSVPALRCVGGGLGRAGELRTPQRDPGQVSSVTACLPVMFR